MDLWIRSGKSNRSETAVLPARNERFTNMAFPRSNERGPIEANGRRPIPTKKLYFRARMSAAPLKHEVWMERLKGYNPISALE